MINKLISKLLYYSVSKFDSEKRNLTLLKNRLIDFFNCGEMTECLIDKEVTAEEIQQDVAVYLKSNGVYSVHEYNAVIDKLMDIISLMPSTVEKKFERLFKYEGSSVATNWLYQYSVDNLSVKESILNDNPRFVSNGLNITINKARPEYRNAEQAKKGAQIAGGYPQCIICKEAEGFGFLNKRALRMISLKLNGENYYWQYSPYGYFREHGIVVSDKHMPMHVDRNTYYKLMDFVDLFPHYFIGCNAALPGIGGSILAHDHFQGGRMVLPLHKAEITEKIHVDKYSNVEIGIVDWPCNVVRLIGKEKNVLAEIAYKIQSTWERYSNCILNIVASDNNGQHNAVSPTVIKSNDNYEINIVLRSNLTDSKHPDGIFHTEPKYQIIKKESIGLLEAQGFFVLPGRLDTQLREIEECVKNGILIDSLYEYKYIFDELLELKEFRKQFSSIHNIIEYEIGVVCKKILSSIAVFKDKAVFKQFLVDDVFSC